MAQSDGALPARVSAPSIRYIMPFVEARGGRLEEVVL